MWKTSLMAMGTPAGRDSLTRPGNPLGAPSRWNANPSSPGGRCQTGGGAGAAMSTAVRRRPVVLSDAGEAAAAQAAHRAEAVHHDGRHELAGEPRQPALLVALAEEHAVAALGRVGLVRA